MKAIRVIVAVTIILLVSTVAYAEKKTTKTVVYKATLHCQSCKAKVEKNIPYEKGVKDLKVDMEAQTVTVTFREDKNTKEQIRKAIEKLNIPVSGVDEQPAKTPVKKEK